MDSGFVTVSATLGKQREIGEEAEAKGRAILSDFGLKLRNLGLITSLDEVDRIKDVVRALDFLVILVATGGTRRLICKICEGTEAFIALWATMSQNSLPSCLEALSRLRRREKSIKLVLGEIHKEAVEEIRFYLHVVEAIKRIEGTKLGVIGRAPTQHEVDRAKNKLGVDLINIDIRKLLDTLGEIPNDEVKEHHQYVMKRFRRIQEPSEKDVLEAVRLYLATRKMLNRMNLTAATIHCFDLIQLIRNTACLSVAFLNDEGFVIGCEGDISPALTMMIVKELTGKPSFMANLARVNPNDNTIILAHCTIAPAMCTQVALRSHFESQLGVSLWGDLPSGEVTICRLGRSLEKMLILEGEIIDGLNEPDLCRTQVKVRINGEVKELLAKTLGNHHILVLGTHKKRLLEFCRLRSIQPITLGREGV